MRGFTGGRKDGCVSRICAEPWNGGREAGGDTAEGLVQSWGTRLVNWNWRVAREREDWLLDFLAILASRESLQKWAIEAKGWGHGGRL